MRIARKLMLLCAMAIAAMAFAATNASALEPVTVVEEPGDPCNPCDIHVVGESSLAAFHVVLVSNCIDEFRALIGPTGNGEVYEWDGVDHSADNPCTREMCEGEHWPFSMEEELGVEHLDVEFCLSPDGDHATRNRCDVTVDVTEEATNNHHYNFFLSQECIINGTPVEVHGEWESEATHEPLEEDEVELLH